MPEVKEPFYIGYLPKAPPPLRRTMQWAVATLAVGCLALAAFLVTAQQPFPDSRFEFGVLRPYQGELVEWPYPMMLAGDGSYLLVGPGKFGVAGQVAGRDGQHVQLSGSLIQHQNQRMLEIDPASLRFAPSSQTDRPPAIDLGPLTVTGEIVDTKCHLGVMNPGNGKVHRECAARCISGGAPPALLVRDASGQTRIMLLVGSDGRPLGRQLLDFVAEPITITGNLVRQGTTFILKAEPQNFRRQ